MMYAVAGKGRSGQAAYEFLEQEGIEAVLLDDADKSLSAVAVLACDAVILSPGIPRTHPAIQAAIKKNVPIYNEVDLAVSKLKNCKFIGVTGTNGKSTTVSILGEIIRQYEPNSFVGGNLGRPLCQALLDGENPKIAVLELSSYQLETLSKLKLDVAVLLNLAPDHLDRYNSVEDYYAAKKKIFDLLKDKQKQVDLTLSPSGRGQGKGGFRLPANLIGPHNIQNAQAATQAAKLLKVPDDLIQQGLDNYKGLAHRLEYLGEKNGVKYFNDSKATNTEAALAAIKCFESGVHWILGGQGKGESYEQIVLEADKRAKAVYLIGEEAEKMMRAFCHPVLDTGSNMRSEERWIPGQAWNDNFGSLNYKTLEVAFKSATQAAKPGDSILLSPACASFDQFKNFEERGDLFRKLFNAL